MSETPVKIEELDIHKGLAALLSAQGYVELYPPQAEAIRQGILQGKNMVLSVPTASGKTLVAVLAMLQAILNGKGRALYLVPLKALASEKYREFKEYESLGIRVAYSTGDYDAVDNRLKNNDLVITTNEKADSLLRHKVDWMSELAVVVSDEVHLINDAHRGPTLEIVLAKLREINPYAQFLALSATIRNADEIAEWLEAKLVTSEWRPTRLKEGVYYNGTVKYKDGTEQTLSPISSDEALSLALQAVKRRKQALVFVNTRRSTETFAKKAAGVLGSFISKNEQRGLKSLATKVLHASEQTRISKALATVVSKGAAFHHAGLGPKHREIVENAFRENQLKILSATPTLCLSKDSVIWNNMDEYKVSDFSHVKYALALHKNRIKPLAIDRIIKFYNADNMIQISSNVGYSIKVTRRHRMLIKRDQQRLIIPAEKIRKNDKIAVIGNLDLPCSYTHSLSFFVKEKMRKSLRINDGQVCYLIGIMVGRDSLNTENSQTALTHNLSGIVETDWFKDIISLVQIGNGEDRQLNQKLLSMGASETAYLLQGMFDSNGHVEGDMISFGSNSFKLVNQVRKLLLRFGIVSRTDNNGRQSIRKNRKSSTLRFGLLIDVNACVLRFNNFIGFRFAVKQKVLDELVSRIEAKKGICLPSISTKYRDKPHESSNDGGENTDFEGDIYWDTIRDIKEIPYEHSVYDVVLPSSPKNDHMFVCNGFVVHNSAGVDLPAETVVVRDYKRYEGGLGYYPIPVLEYRQMRGRAGRPRYDKEGFAFLVAKRPGEQEYLLEKYICGPTEQIWSKLASEPAMRMHLLATITTGFANDREGLIRFINKTFYSQQYEAEDIEYVLDRVLTFLINEDLLRPKGKRLIPSPLGNRTSQLYIDPKTAVILRDAMQYVQAENLNPSEIGLLQLVAHTPDMETVYLRKGDFEKFSAYADLHNEDFMFPPPDQYLQPTQYEFFLSELKTASILLSWANEVPEDEIIGEYNVGSGDILRLVSTAEWLLHAASEIAGLFKHSKIKGACSRLRARVKYGCKAELLPIIQLPGIGRVRGRILYNAGFTSVRKIAEADAEQLSRLPLIGSETVHRIKDYLGLKINKNNGDGKQRGEEKGSQVRLTDYDR
ncbi:MAG: DEAD/DEAH box helicase [Candidatus Ranarchaeia archaeon]